MVLIVALLHVLLSPRVELALAHEPERWACDIDLHNGDAGRLEFERTETGIQGTLAVRRGGTGASIPSSIRGSWGREVIRFTRTLASGGEESFVGIAVGTEPGRISMAGRSGVGFAGVWSAICSTGASRGSGAEPNVQPPAPAPPTPTPTPPTPAPAASCAITVAAAGPRADLARIYQLVLRGPDSMTAVKARRPFGTGSVTFSDLPDGRYLLTLDTKADVSVNIDPRRHDVVCRAGRIDVVFNFR